MLGRESQPTDRIFADGLRTALAAHLIGNYTVDRWRPPARTTSLDAKRLQRVLDFMEAQLADDLSLDDLAREACLSPYHFSRLFHEATGRPPHRYLIERRIQVAQQMLQSERSSMAEVAFDTGFGSQASFARTFRKVTGVTPSQYREQSRRRMCNGITVMAEIHATAISTPTSARSAVASASAPTKCILVDISKTYNQEAQNETS
jgi:AraC family transcriptional regulator